MKVSHEKPPIYEQCKKAFGIDWDKGIIITYGDTAYSKNPLTPDLEVHEQTHVQQQTLMDKDIWWDRYFKDKEFRLSQEVEAYRNQLAYIRANYNRHTRRFLEQHIYNSLANIYGGLCTKEEAEKILN